MIDGKWHSDIRQLLIFFFLILMLNMNAKNKIIFTRLGLKKKITGSTPTIITSVPAKFYKKRLMILLYSLIKRFFL